MTLIKTIGSAEFFTTQVAHLKPLKASHSGGDQPAIGFDFKGLNLSLYSLQLTAKTHVTNL